MVDFRELVREGGRRELGSCWAVDGDRGALSTTLCALAAPERVWRDGNGFVGEWAKRTRKEDGERFSQSVPSSTPRSQIEPGVKLEQMHVSP